MSNLACSRIQDLSNFQAGIRLLCLSMGRACDTYGGRGESCAGFWGGNLMERDSGVVGSILNDRWMGGC
jgi:hypothetical protein